MATRNNVRRGTCTNFGNGCTNADTIPPKVIELGILEDFDCPECGKELSEVKVKFGSSPKLIGIIVAALLLVGAGVFVVLNMGSEKTTGFATTDDTTVVEAEPEPDEVPEELIPPVEDTPTTTIVNTRSLSFAYGGYEGDTRNALPHGQGKMTYKSRTRISQYDDKERYAEAGQYIIGQWKKGLLESGKLYDKGGNFVSAFMIGLPPSATR